MVKSNLIANFLGQGWTALMGIAFVPLYVKSLGLESYGLIGFFATLQVCLNLLDLGITPTIGREMARFSAGAYSNQGIRNLLRSVEVVVYCFMFLVGSMVFFGSDWIATSWLRAEELPKKMVVEAISLMGLVIALRLIESVYRSAIIGLQYQVIYNLINSFLATFRWAGAAVIVVYISPTIQAFFIWQAMVSIATLIILSLTTYSFLPKGSRAGRFSIDTLRPVMSFMAGMTGISFLSLVLTQADKILLSNLLSLKEFGFYTLAGIIASGLYVVVGPITQTFYPRFCGYRARNDEIAFIKNYHLAAQLVSAIMGSVAAVIFINSELILILWTQNNLLASETNYLLKLLVLGTMLNGLMWVPYQAQLAYGWTSLTVWVNIVAVLFIVPAILWITPKYGMHGAAWVWIALNIGYIFLAAQIMYKRILASEKWRWYIKDLLIPIASAFLCALLIQNMPISPLTSVYQLTYLLTSLFITLLASIMASENLRVLLMRNLKHIISRKFMLDNSRHG